MPASGHGSARRLEAVELGHLDVHEDHVVGRFARARRSPRGRCRRRPRRSPAAASRRSASFWFTALSSASRIRSGWRSPSRRRASTPARTRSHGLRPRRRGRRGSASWSARRLDRLRERSRRRSAGAASRSPSEDTTITGSRCGSVEVAGARPPMPTPSMSGIDRSRSATSNALAVAHPAERLVRRAGRARRHPPAGAAGRSGSAGSWRCRRRSARRLPCEPDSTAAALAR